VQPLRPLSTRPTLIDDPWGFIIIDPTTGARVGVPKPTGRMRLVYALPVNESDKGPLMVEPHHPITDPWGFLLVDPVSGYVVGKPGLWCHRWVGARWTEDTRRL
jgi:hypothetical protein